jgi:hypothetical protein
VIIIRYPGAPEFSGSDTGYGTGYGDGFGYGYGTGSGYGYGDGFGYGYGYGYGDGDGFGDGYGYGYGYGYGDGYEDAIIRYPGAPEFDDGYYGSGTDGNGLMENWKTYWTALARSGLMRAKHIFAHSNSERRRELIEIMGYEAFLRDADARLVAEDRCGKLWEIPDIPVRFVELTDRTPRPDGTYRVYIEPVPREIKTPIEAEAWQWQFSEREFRAMLKKGWVET